MFDKITFWISIIFIIIGAVLGVDNIFNYAPSSVRGQLVTHGQRILIYATYMLIGIYGLYLCYRYRKKP